MSAYKQNNNEDTGLNIICTTPQPITAAMALISILRPLNCIEIDSKNIYSKLNGFIATWDEIS